MKKLKIDTSKPVRFYPDRGLFKYDAYNMVEVLFETENICLCRAEEDMLILFHKDTCEVLTNNLDCYYAQNY